MQREIVRRVYPHTCAIGAMSKDFDMASGTMHVKLYLGDMPFQVVGTGSFIRSDMRAGEAREDAFTVLPTKHDGTTRTWTDFPSADFAILKLTSPVDDLSRIGFAQPATVHVGDPIDV